MSGDTYTANKLNWLEALAMDSRLHSTAVRVAVVIAKRLNRQTGEAFPSIKTIAAESATPERSVERAVSDLCKTGYLERRRGGFSKPNYYSIPDTSPHRCNAGQVSIPATGGVNEPVSPAIHGGSDDAIPAMGGGSVPPLVADQSRHGWRTNPLTEPSEKEPKEETYSPASEIEVSAAARESSPPDWKQGFEAFWAQYPRKVGKGAAEKAYKAAVKTASAENILAGCLRFSAAEHAAYAEGRAVRWTPHAATWLNARRWEDEPDPVVLPVNRPAVTNADRKAVASEVAQKLKDFADARRNVDGPSAIAEAPRMRMIS